MVQHWSRRGPSSQFFRLQAGPDFKLATTRFESENDGGGQLKMRSFGICFHHSTYSQLSAAPPGSLAHAIGLNAHIPPAMPLGTQPDDFCIIRRDQPQPCQAFFHAGDVSSRGHYSHPRVVVAVGVPGVLNIVGPCRTVTLRPGIPSFPLCRRKALRSVWLPNWRATPIRPLHASGAWWG